MAALQYAINLKNDSLEITREGQCSVSFITVAIRTFRCDCFDTKALALALRLKCGRSLLIASVRTCYGGYDSTTDLSDVYSTQPGIPDCKKVCGICALSETNAMLKDFK